MRRNETYGKILNVAYELFAKLGYEGTSMAVIAKEMKFSKPALYNYFENKEQIFETLYSEVIKEIVKDFTIDQDIRSLATYKDYVIEKGIDQISYLKVHPEFSDLMMQFFLLGLRNKSIQDLTDELMNTTRKYYEQLIDLGIECEAISQENKHVYLEMFIMIDQSILEQSNKISEEMLIDIWKTFVKKLL